MAEGFVKIKAALQRSNGDAYAAVDLLLSSKPPNLKSNKLNWFQYFDPYNHGLTKEDVALALEQTFGGDLKTIDFNESIKNIWPNFVPGDMRISGEVFAEADGLGDTIIEYMVPIYLNVNELHGVLPGVPRQVIHDTLVSCGGDRDAALIKLRAQPQTRIPVSAKPVVLPSPSHAHTHQQQAHITRYLCGRCGMLLPSSSCRSQCCTSCGVYNDIPLNPSTTPNAHPAPPQIQPSHSSSHVPLYNQSQPTLVHAAVAPGPPNSPPVPPCFPSVPAGYTTSHSANLPAPTINSATQASSSSGYRPPSNLHPPISAPPLGPTHPPRRPVYRALLIGINYTGQQGALRGCVNDVISMHSLLTRTFNWPTGEMNMRVLTDERSIAGHRAPTRKNIIEGMHWLAHDVKPGDALFFHYSGHGSQQEDPHGIEEDGMNETILPVDFRREGMITDDEISAILVQTLPDGVRLTAVMDSCHSGTGLDLPYTWNPSRRLFEEETNPYHSLGDVVLFSGCEDGTTSCDVQSAFSAPGGAMTTAFVAALQTNPCPTYDQLLDELLREMKANGFSQKPQMSSTQEFDFGRPFSVFDALPNTNTQIGRTIRKKFSPNKIHSFSGQNDPVEQITSMINAVLFGGMLGSLS